MHMDDARALIERAPRLARHLLRRYRHRIDGGVGQHAGQRAGEDGLVHLQASPSATITNRSSRACAWPPCAAAAWVMTPSIGERMEYCIFIASTVASACPRRTRSPAIASTATMTPLTGERTAPSDCASLGSGGAYVRSTKYRQTPSRASQRLSP